MDWSGGESQEQRLQPEPMPPFPRIWVGYLLGSATFVAEIVAISLHPEIITDPFSLPLYLFLANFISLIYCMVCVYEFHLVLSRVTAGAYPIKPLRAAWFHLIPFYGFYWVFKWSREMARFINARLQTSSPNPEKTGLKVFGAFAAFLVLDRGVGMMLLFWCFASLSRSLRQALSVQPGSPGGPLPFS